MFRIDPKAFVVEPELIRILRKHATLSVREEDGPLFRQDGLPLGLYIFLEGSVTLSFITEDDQSLFSAQALPGSILGLPATVSEKPYSLTATARAGTRICFVSREDFVRLMASQPGLPSMILKVLAIQVHRSRKSLE